MSEEIEQDGSIAGKVFAGVVFALLVSFAVLVNVNPAVTKRVHGLYYDNLSNLVEPGVRAEVWHHEGLFYYSYTIENGPWAAQEVRDVAIQTGLVTEVETRLDWESGFAVFNGGRIAKRWRLSAGSREGGVGRGESISGFKVAKAGLPVIVETHAGSLLIYREEGGLLADTTTAAGTRIVGWTVGPGVAIPSRNPSTVLRKTSAQVNRAVLLNWFYDVNLGITIEKVLLKAADEIDAGDADMANARLKRLLETVEQNSGVAMSEEAYAIVGYPVAYARSLLNREEGSWYGL